MEWITWPATSKVTPTSSFKPFSTPSESMKANLANLFDTCSEWRCPRMRKGSRMLRAKTKTVCVSLCYCRCVALYSHYNLHTFYISSIVAVVADIIQQLFEGTLRSVLICDECGSKRPMPESFLNVSVPLSKHVGERNASGARVAQASMNLERCLQQFTSPETLTDPVDCPSCGRKTPHKKQHTFAKLPKVLCLHLKRFDAANKNRKIDDFVSFPAHGLDMGNFLPHW